MRRTSEEWISEYRARQALWIHDGNPKRPHAELTSGNHSSGFFNSRPIIADDSLMRDAAADLVELFIRQGERITNVQGVVGPQTGATKLAEYISDHIRAQTGECCWASPAKSEDGHEKKMFFSDTELLLLSRKIILSCEDVIKTGGSVKHTSEAASKAGAWMLPFILTLVNRSGLPEAGRHHIIALIDHPMPMWAPNDCLLCRQGSRALRPKDPGSWALLTAAY